MQNYKPCISPALRYADAPAAIEWLVKAFNFEKQAVYTNTDGSIAHAELSFGNGMVMIGSSKDDFLKMKTPRELGAVSQVIYVVVTDTDKHCERATQAGAEIVRGLQNTDYGSRDYSARDPEGNLWSFGTYQPEIKTSAST